MPSRQWADGYALRGRNGKTIIGASGTAISKSLRGTVTWNPANLAAQTCSSTSITVTGAVSGADCGMSQPNPSGGASVIYGCQASTDVCSITALQWDRPAFSPSDRAPNSCRVFNP